MQTTALDELLTPAALAKELEIAVQTLSNWRSLRRYDLPFIKCGGHVRYRRSDVERFLASRTIASQPSTKEGSANA
jgi:hypothetical protein